MRTVYLRRIIDTAILAFSIVLFVGATSGQETTKGRVVLKVHGEISGLGPEAVKSFTVEDLEALGMVQVKTETPWTDGIVTFEGVLGRKVLSAVDAKGRLLKARALNDYIVDIPTSDFEEFDVILATRIDGQRLSVRDRGPLWVIYPWSENRSLQSDTFYSRSIWQLQSIQVLFE